MKNNAWNLLLLFPILAPAVRAEVDMKAGMCVETYSQFTPNYTNKNPQSWDLQGFGATVGAGTLEGKFETSGKAQNLIGTNASPTARYTSCGAKGTPTHLQVMAKTGYCNEIDPPESAKPLQCAALDAAMPNYDAGLCVKDSLGVDRGDGFGGIVDSYRDQTQIQVRLPAASWNQDGKTVKFDPAKSMGGPFYMMSMSAIQEYLLVDMQFLLALGASKSGAGLVDAATGTSLYVPSTNLGTGDDSKFGSFGLNYPTVQKIYDDYPKYFPALWDLGGTVAEGGTGPTKADSPQQINSGIMGAMNLWWYLDATQVSADFCFKQFIRSAADKSAGLKVLIAGYENGYLAGGGTNDYASQVLPKEKNPAALAAADITPYMKPYLWGVGTPANGTQQYITSVFSTLTPLAQSGSNCSGETIYDAPITKTQMLELFFGQGGTAAKQGPGGLMWHFKITAAQKTAMAAELSCAFDKLAGKAPSTQGQAAVSFRYDWLTLLRVAKSYFPEYLNKFGDKPTPPDPSNSAFFLFVASHSKAPCAAASPDTSWPKLFLSGDTLALGQMVEGAATKDDRGIRSREYSVDKDWLSWIPAATGFSVPATLQPTDRLWYRVTDSCGNATIEEVKWSIGPPLDKVVATPPGGPFFGSVSVTLDVPSVTGEIIYYTTDGSTPTYSSPKFDPAKPIVLTGDATIKAFAGKSGYSPSAVESWTFTKQTQPVTKAPTADPPGRTFTTLDPDFPVTLIPGETGSVIYYTTNGNPPDTVEGVDTKKYSGPITIGGTTTIKAIATKAGQIASPILVATYTETEAPKVAKPVATPPGSSGASPYKFLSGPLAVTLTVATDGAAILVVLDDGAPAPYTGALSLTKTTTLKAVATKAGSIPSDTLVVQYLFTPPVSVAKAWYLDKDGDGRIETAIVEFEKDLPVAPSKLAFSIRDEAGQTADRTAEKGAIVFAAGSMKSLVVTFSDPFPFGMTSVANRDASGKLFQQDDIPLLDNAFPVDDSVPPVVAKALVQEPDSANPEKRIFLTLSEITNMPLTSQTALLFKHEGEEAPSSQVRISRMEKTGDRNFVVYIDTGSAIYPIVGDFAALAADGSVRDQAGNAPSAKTWRVLEGEVPKPKPADIYVTFPNGKKDKASDGPEAQGDMVFIPMDAGGNALSGSASDGKCQGSCYTGEKGTFVGPVFHIVTAGPVSYDFKIFNNVGEFLAAGKGRFEAKDLQLMSKTNDASGVKYVARVVWTGRTSQGVKAGTGAYILQCVLTTEKDTRTGAPPSSEKKRVVFGLLRSFKGS